MFLIPGVTHDRRRWVVQSQNSFERGFIQQHAINYEETFTPVAQMVIIRFLLDNGIFTRLA